MSSRSTSPDYRHLSDDEDDEFMFDYEKLASYIRYISVFLKKDFSKIPRSLRKVANVMLIEGLTAIWSFNKTCDEALKIAAHVDFDNTTLKMMNKEQRLEECDAFINILHTYLVKQRNCSGQLSAHEIVQTAAKVFKDKEKLEALKEEATNHIK